MLKAAQQAHGADALRAVDAALAFPRPLAATEGFDGSRETVKETRPMVFQKVAPMFLVENVDEAVAWYQDTLGPYSAPSDKGGVMV